MGQILQLVDNCSNHHLHPRSLPRICDSVGFAQLELERIVRGVLTVSRMSSKMGFQIVPDNGQNDQHRLGLLGLIDIVFSKLSLFYVTLLISV